MQTISLTSEDPCKDEVSRISVLVRRPYVAEYELVEAAMTRYPSLDGIDWHENSPGQEPDGKERPDDHSQEAHEKVSIESAGLLNEFVVCSYDR